jgi:hypothetical protein
VLLAAIAALSWPAASQAAVTTFGSPLAVPATLDTANDLNYTGADIALPGSIFHIPHDGADTALWNVEQPTGSPTAPMAGQITKIALEGCAEHPQGAPAPLTQIHFQDLVPQPGGGVKVNVSSQAFEIPVCGENGASGSTVTNYAPTNFCVAQGDYVDFNDEGGFVPSNSGAPPYPAGVPYKVIGAVKGATMDSFIRNGGTNNGDAFSPQDTTYHDGFASNKNEELLLQATLATGSDAISSCGGTQTPAGVHKAPTVVLPPLRVGKQTDGINSHKIASVAVYCRPAGGCTGQLTLTTKGARQARSITKGFKLPGGKTSHVAVRVPSAIVALARKKRRTGVPMQMTAVVEGKTFAQTIVLRIF